MPTTYQQSDNQQGAAMADALMRQVLASQAQERAAKIAADAQKYGFDTQLAGTNAVISGQKYGEDQRLAGLQYQTDAEKALGFDRNDVELATRGSFAERAAADKAAAAADLNAKLQLTGSFADKSALADKERAAETERVKEQFYANRVRADRETALAAGDVARANAIAEAINSNRGNSSYQLTPAEFKSTVYQIKPEASPQDKAAAAAEQAGNFSEAARIKKTGQIIDPKIAANEPDVQMTLQQAAKYADKAGSPWTFDSTKKDALRAMNATLDSAYQQLLSKGLSEMQARASLSKAIVAMQFEHPDLLMPVQYFKATE